MRHKLAGTLASLVMLSVTAGPARAQDRMPPIPADKYTDAQKKAAEEFAGGRGYEVRGPFVPLIRSPEVMLRAKAMGDHLRFKSALAPRLSEMVILITAREWTQQYEWVAHHDIAIKAGLRKEIADAIADGRRPVGMADDEEAAYDMSTEIQRSRRVSDATWNRAVAKFGEQGVIARDQRLLHVPGHDHERGSNGLARRGGGALEAVSGLTMPAVHQSETSGV